MRISDFAKLLVETAAPSKVGNKQAVFINRLLMRLFSVPSLISALADVGIVVDGDEQDEQQSKPVKVQLDFQKLPPEAVPLLMTLIAAPGEVRVLKYAKNGQARNGFEFEVKSDDLEGDDYEYANA